VTISKPFFSTDSRTSLKPDDCISSSARLLIFAVSKIEDMLIEFKAHYYAEEFPR
jgi:hypothetical protein